MLPICLVPNDEDTTSSKYSAEEKPEADSQETTEEKSEDKKDDSDPSEGEHTEL